MKFSEQWLGEWLAADVDSDYLHERLTMSGLEVDGIEPAAADFSGVVVAKVIAIEPHPDADKLRVCSVDSGTETLQVVCGAANVRVDLVVPLATIGAKLPGDFKIKKSKLRGVESYGMLCSAKELGMVDEAEGLLELADDLSIGENIRSALQLDDNIIELSLTPNRGDCLSISGIARDVAVFCDVPFKGVDVEAVKVDIDSVRAVHLDAPASCPKYTGRIIKGVNVQAETPLWMQEKLRRSALRSISPVVDITNYVMLELGQPMHAFDNNKLIGAVHVRYAKQNEKLTLLDGQEYELDTDILIIADDENPLAMAGIMGGLDSSVTDSTHDIFLECAFFTPEKIIGDARKYSLHTDSSHRFERGVDFNAQVNAIESATQLILAICGGQVGPLIEEMVFAELPKRHSVQLRANQIQRILGLEMAVEKVQSIFERLGMQVEPVVDGWQVTPPSYRFDIAIEVDLIEEIARVVGYDNIEVQSFTSNLSMHAESIEKTTLNKIRNLLIYKGYQEAITYSFIGPKLSEQFSDGQESLALANPISTEMSLMRTSLIPGLMQALQYNVNRQQPRLRLFESGLVFQDPSNLKQIPKLAGVIYGEIEPEQWDKRTTSCDFFDLKADVEAILRLFIESGDVTFIAIEQKSMHPLRTSQILLNSKAIGIIGAVHPTALEKADLGKFTYVFELDLASICTEKVFKYHEISKFPSVRRDISILTDVGIPVTEIIEIIKKSSIKYLKKLELFDLYQGEGIDIGKKSLTFGLTFQRSSSTLMDREVETMVGDILALLQKQFGATLRE